MTYRVPFWVTVVRACTEITFTGYAGEYVNEPPFVPDETELLVVEVFAEVVEEVVELTLVDVELVPDVGAIAEGA